MIDNDNDNDSDPHTDPRIRWP